MGTQKPQQSFAFIDVSDVVGAASKVVPVLEDYCGTATIAGYTVLYSGDKPVRAIVIADTPASERVVANSEEPFTVGRMLDAEMCGCAITVEGQIFRLAAPATQT